MLLNSKSFGMVFLLIFNILSYFCLYSIPFADETNSLQNANTISYTTTTNEQIDNAELQEKSTMSSGLDDNENDKESKHEDGIKTAACETTTTPVVADLNNGPFNDESYVSFGHWP